MVLERKVPEKLEVVKMLELEKRPPPQMEELMKLSSLVRLTSNELSDSKLTSSCR